VLYHFSFRLLKFRSVLSNGSFSYPCLSSSNFSRLLNKQEQSGRMEVANCWSILGYLVRSLDISQYTLPHLKISPYTPTQITGDHLQQGSKAANTYKDLSFMSHPTITLCKPTSIFKGCTHSHCPQWVYSLRLDNRWNNLSKFNHCTSHILEHFFPVLTAYISECELNLVLCGLFYTHQNSEITVYSD
jgi:hypothetical protein